MSRELFREFATDFTLTMVTSTLSIPAGVTFLYLIRPGVASIQGLLDYALNHVDSGEGMDPPLPLTLRGAYQFRYDTFFKGGV